VFSENQALLKESFFSRGQPRTKHILECYKAVIIEVCLFLSNKFIKKAQVTHANLTDATEKHKNS